MFRSLMAVALCAATQACGEPPASGGVEALPFEGGALDGSEDAALAADAVLAADAAPPAGTQPLGAAADAELEALAASYRTLPIDELLASMGLARDETTQMMELPDDTIRELAIARLRERALDPDDGGLPEARGDGTLQVRFRHLSLDALDDFEFEEVMDELMEGTVRFPEPIAALDGKRIAVTGYMIPETWKRTKVTDFMLVRDLLACCFGGAPQPDEWIHVAMKEGRGTPYFPFVPMEVTGTLRIVGIDDGSGYAGGCFRLEGLEAREID